MSAINPAGGTALTPGSGSVDEGASAIEKLLEESGALSDTPDEGSQSSQTAEAEDEAATQPAEDEAEAQDGVADADPAKPDKAVKEPDLIEVKANGQTLKVTLDELKKGYARESDYTRNNMAAVETQRKADQQAQAAAQVAAMLQSELDKIIPQEQAIDWDKLYQENPAEYARWKIHFQELKEKRSQAVQVQQGVFAKQQQAQQAQMEAFHKQEWAKLVEKVPDFADPKKGEALKAEGAAYLRGLGFSNEEISANITDHRIAIAVREAALYRKMMATKSATDKKVQNLPKVAKPGAAPEVGDASRQKVVALHSKAAKSGRVEDAAALIATMLS